MCERAFVNVCLHISMCFKIHFCVCLCVCLFVRMDCMSNVRACIHQCVSTYIHVFQRRFLRVTVGLYVCSYVAYVSIHHSAARSITSVRKIVSQPIFNRDTPICMFIRTSNV